MCDNKSQIFFTSQLENLAEDAAYSFHGEASLVCLRFVLAELNSRYQRLRLSSRHLIWTPVIRMLSRNNPPTMAKYMVRHRKPPLQTWRTNQAPINQHFAGLQEVKNFKASATWQ
jgi:hypothetical protein